MTPTPEEVVKCLRGEAKDWGCGMATVGSGMLTDAADLITAQAETLRQMREALEELNAAFCAVCSGHGPGTFALYRKETTLVRDALALPICEAEQQARENAEKAGLLDAFAFSLGQEGFARLVKAAREASDGK